ncbi:MAG TPA: acyltransferase domain-containing protein [Microbacteriaceae bacterium]
MSVLSELSDRLSAAYDDHALATLGFREDDRVDVRRAIEAAMSDTDRLSEIERLAGRLRAGIGDFGSTADTFDDPAATSDWRGIGVLPMLALLAVTDDVRTFHRSRGISAAVSDRSLSDLGQQAWVHRRTFGAFGLHTYGWMATAFSGNLYWLGRLQFNLVHRADGWAVSTHIPESGHLTPESVDDSFRQAVAFFAERFSDYPTRLFHCGSWLLDPQLADVLKPESNMVKFQKRWALEGEPTPADADAIFFVFRRRNGVDRSTLPRETSLQRAILDKLDTGGHWNSWDGTVEQAPFLSLRPSDAQTRYKERM